LDVIPFAPIDGKKVIRMKDSGRNRLKEVVLGEVMAKLVIIVGNNQFKPDEHHSW